MIYVYWGEYIINNWWMTWNALLNRFHQNCTFTFMTFNRMISNFYRDMRTKNFSVLLSNWVWTLRLFFSIFGNMRFILLLHVNIFLSTNNLTSMIKTSRLEICSIFWISKTRHKYGWFIKYHFNLFSFDIL